MQQCLGITSACEPGPLTWRARCERRFSVARLSLCLSHHPPPHPTPPHPPPLTHTKATCASPPKPTHSPKQGSLSIPLVHTNNTESCHTHMHTELHVSCVARKSFPYHLLSFSHKCDLTRRLSRPQEQTCWASLVTEFMVFFISPITSPHFHSLPILKEKKDKCPAQVTKSHHKNKI